LAEPGKAGGKNKSVPRRDILVGGGSVIAVGALVAGVSGFVTNGWPARKTLEELSLKKAADTLAAKGRLRV
jgi:hypothetical protein